MNDWQRNRARWYLLSAVMSPLVILFVLAPGVLKVALMIAMTVLWFMFAGRFFGSGDESRKPRR